MIAYNFQWNTKLQGVLLFAQKKFENITNKEYRFEPLDEAHKEIIKRVFNLQKVINLEVLLENFKIVL